MNALIKIITVSLLLSVVSMGLMACGGNEPSPDKPTPTVSEEEPNPQDGEFTSYPARIEIEMSEGHLHPNVFHGNPSIEDFPLKKVQRMTLKREGNGYVHAGGEKVIRLVSRTLWSIIISLYDEAGNRINSKYLTSEEAKINQMFCYITNVKDLKTGQAKTLKQSDIFPPFVYRDTNPEDKMIFPGKDEVVLTESNVGFKGYWGDSYEVANEDYSGESFGGGIRAKYITFDINFFFMKFKSAEEKAPRGKVHSAFDTNAMKKASLIFKFKIPARIFANRPYSDKEQEQEILDYMEEFGKPRDEMERLIDEYNNMNSESAVYFI
ncbi:MAG: hypothetical protein SPI72_04630 [Porphyromonas sp.]|nr:hypothetical protein [Porphyromonas sp.]